MDLPPAIEKYWSHALALAATVGGGVKWWVDARAKQRTDAVAQAAARQVAKLDLAKLVREETAEIIQRLREEVDHWTGEVDKLRSELRGVQGELSRMIAAGIDKDAEIALLKGRNRQLEASIAAHRRLMIANGLQPPAEPVFFELSDGELKTFAPTLAPDQ